MKIILIHNPDAGDGDVEAEAPSLRQIIETAGHSVIEVGRQELESESWLAHSADLVVISGGDGTIGRAAKRIAGQNVPLVALATGTANNIALTLGIEACSLGEQVRSWPTSRRSKVDIATVTAPWGTERLIEGMGVGLFASSIEVADRSLENQSDLPSQQRVTHVLQILKERLGAFPASHVGATLDGRDISGDYIVFEVMNIRFVGPNLFLAPDADPGDGLLDIVLVDGEERDMFAGHLASWQRGAKVPPRLRCERGRELRLDWTGFDVHLDDVTWPPKEARGAVGTGLIEVRMGDHYVEFLVP